MHLSEKGCKVCTHNKKSSIRSMKIILIVLQLLDRQPKLNKNVGNTATLEIYQRKTNESFSIYHTVLIKNVAVSTTSKNGTLLVGLVHNII